MPAVLASTSSVSASLRSTRSERHSCLISQIVPPISFTHEESAVTSVTRSRSASVVKFRVGRCVMNPRMFPVSVAASLLRRGLPLACVMTAIVLCCCGQLSAENKALKGDLERALEGKTFVSTVVLGGKAVPRGYSTDYPVNTIVSSDGQVTYRVEWGLMRTDVALREIRRRFDRGTSFRVTTVDLKDDRLELKLENATGDSAKLKLLLGSNWQSQMDVAAVLNALSHVLLDQQHYDRTQSQASLVQDQTKARVESGQISTRTANEVSQLRATSNQLYIQTQYAYGVSSYSGKDYQAA